MTSQAAPVTPGERIATLDAIRGFALLGIFIMNMPLFNSSFFAGADGTRPWPQWWDRSAEIVRDVVFSGKFNSMFSMLFAIGFTIQLERLFQREPERAVGVYARRIFWLLVFGILHACIFWTGDILHMYALLGFLLLVLRKLPDRIIVLLIAACLSYPAIIGVIRLMIMSPQDVEELAGVMRQWQAADNAVYGHGTFLEIVRHNAQAMVLYYTHPQMRWNLLGGYMQIVTTMLLGLLLGRHRFFQNITTHLPLVRRVQWWALGGGLACGIVFGTWDATVLDPMKPTVWRIIAGMSYVLCRVGIMIFYVTVIIRAMQSDTWRRRLAPLTLAGRMPLTNYLMQTLIGTFLFYHWGLGLWGTVGPALDLVLAVAIFFIVQVPLTQLWLANFQIGPLEYLWRVLTYGRSALRGSTDPRRKLLPGEH
jgi:uncharacterized protein